MNVITSDLNFSGKYVLRGKSEQVDRAINTIKNVKGDKVDFFTINGKNNKLTIVATNNRFSKEAIILATENNVLLIDRDVLMGLIKQTGVKVSSTETKFSCFSSAERKKIESKYPHWI